MIESNKENHLNQRKGPKSLNYHRIDIRIVKTLSLEIKIGKIKVVDLVVSKVKSVLLMRIIIIIMKVNLMIKVTSVIQAIRFSKDSK
jgi:hypothetical protein